MAEPISDQAPAPSPEPPPPTAPRAAASAPAPEPTAAEPGTAISAPSGGLTATAADAGTDEAPTWQTHDPGFLFSGVLLSFPPGAVGSLCWRTDAMAPGDYLTLVAAASGRESFDASIPPSAVFRYRREVAGGGDDPLAFRIMLAR